MPGCAGCAGGEEMIQTLFSILQHDYPGVELVSPPDRFLTSICVRYKGEVCLFDSFRQEPEEILVAALEFCKLVEYNKNPYAQLWSKKQ
jgi:hypothetical protein